MEKVQNADFVRTKRTKNGRKKTQKRVGTNYTQNEQKIGIYERHIT